MKKIILSIIILASMLAADNGREGAMTAIGLGIGSVSSSLDGKKSVDAVDTSWALKFGYGFTPNLVAFAEGSIQAVTKDLEQSSIGVGLSYYLEDEPNSPYFSVYVGDVEHSIVSTVPDSSSGSFGDLWKLGAGYEYKQWFFQVDYINAQSSRVKSDGVFGSIGYNFHIFR
jgi:hypothetical protein